MSAIALLLVATPVWAQTPAIPKIEFDDAIRQAIEKNPDVAQAALVIARAQTLITDARAATLPTANLGFTNTTLDAARGFAAGVTQSRNQSTLSLTTSAPIFNLYAWAGLAQARDQVSLAQLSAAEARRATAVAAAQAYLAVITQKRQVEVETRAVDSTHAHLDYAQKRLDGGAGSRLNQLRAAQAVASEEGRLENARLGVRRAQEALGVILASEGPVDAGAEPGLETPPAVPDTQWLSDRTDVQLQTGARKAAERLLSDSWKKWIGTGTASFDPQYTSPQSLFLPSKTWRFTVSFTQPVLDGRLRGSSIPRQLAVKQAALTLSRTEIQARSEVRLARESIASFERALDSMRLAATRSNDVLRITTSAFEVGATTNIEVIDAQRSARDAESVATLAEDAVRRAKLDLLVAMGRFPR